MLAIFILLVIISIKYKNLEEGEFRLDKTIYFDNAATTQISSEVFKKMMPYLTEEYFNPSSLYSKAQKVKNAIEEARKNVAEALGADPNEIYFTSGATESNNWAINLIVEQNKKNSAPCHIITSKIEHPSVLNVFKRLEKDGLEVSYLNVDAEGRVSPDELERTIKNNTVLVSVMYANNEVGTLQPISELGKICHKYGVVFHTDAVQAVGNVKINVLHQNIDMLSLSGHKFHAPKGVGALYVRNGLKIGNLLVGGGQERGKRAGTENVASIVGLGCAITEATKDIEAKNKHLKELREMLWSGVRKIAKVKYNGSLEHGLTGTLNFSFEGIEGEGILLLLNSYGICCSSGSACTSGSLDPSHVLLAMGLDHGLAQSSVRISLSKYNTLEEVAKFLEVINPIVERLRKMSPVWN